MSLPNSIINIADRLSISFNGFSYSMPSYIQKKLFYAKNINQNLSVTPLFRLVKAYLRSKSLDSFEEILSDARRSGASEEQVSEIISALQKAAEFDFESRRDTGDKDLQAFYKNSKF